MWSICKQCRSSLPVNNSVFSVALDSLVNCNCSPHPIFDTIYLFLLINLHQLTFIPRNNNILCTTRPTMVPVVQPQKYTVTLMAENSFWIIQNGDEEKEVINN